MRSCLRAVPYAKGALPSHGFKIKKLLNTEGFRVNSDAGALITEWNRQASQDSALSGGKRVAVLNLLGLDEEVLETLVGHQSRMGAAQSAFTDDAFSNKKLMPGHQSRVLGGGPHGVCASAPVPRASTSAWPT